MARVPHSEFEHALRTADTDDVVAFVADLWAARGWDTTVDGRTIVAIDETTATRRVLVVVHKPSRLHGLRPSPRLSNRDDIDAVVSIGRGAPNRSLTRDGLEFIDEELLFELVVYAVDEQTRARLCRTHLDRSAAIVESSVSTSDFDGFDTGMFGVDMSVRRLRTTFDTTTGRIVVSLFLISVLLIAAGGVATHSDAGSSSETIPPTEYTIDRPTSEDVSTGEDHSGAFGSPPEADVERDHMSDGASRPVIDVETDRNVWRMVGFGPTRTGYTPDTRGPERRVVETDGVSLTYPVPSSPAIVDDTIYVNRYDGTVFAMDATRFAIEWRKPLGGSITTSPSVVDGVVYVGTAERSTSGGVQERSSSFESSHTVYALSASNGSVRWALDLGPIVFSSPAVVDNSVYVGSQRGRIYEIDAMTGAVRWHASVDGEIRSSPAVVNDTVYVDDSVGTIHAFDTATGRERWRVTITDGVISTPAVANDTVYVGGSDGRVYALDAATGTERWNVSVDDAVVSSPAVANDTVYVGSRIGHVYALDAATGTIRWRTAVDGQLVSSPVVANTTVYVGSRDGNVYSGTSKGHVYAVDAATGTVRWNLTTTGPVSSSPAVVAGRLYVGDDYGGVHLFVECRPRSDRFGSPSIATRKQCR